MHRYRTHTCGALRERDIGAAVRLSGWCHRIRDHGGLLFIDLRDHYGLAQCVADPDSPAFAAAERLRAEWVVRIDGTVRKRPEGTLNPELPTGAVEVFISEIEVLSPAAELPLPVFGEPDYPEDIRLKYRFLDLRREHLHANIVKRIAVIDSLRTRMKAQGFSEFQTPILTASSPEGARDFLVPSRLHPGKFYALPQAPQQFKQLLMVAGFDRYFQIAPCFRDEDPRADRLPGEFYQLDVEMSFVTQDDVFGAMEPVLRGTFEEFCDGWPVTRKFPRISYREAMRKYGTDKPDLRNPLIIADVSEEFGRAEVEFKAFKNKTVRAIPAPGAAAQPRSFFDKLNEWARADLGAPGLGYVVFEADGGKGPIAKFIPAEVQQKIAAAAGAKAGDAVFFAAGREEEAAKIAGAARTRLGEELSLIDEKQFALAWIVDFPMYEWNDLDKKIDFSHNPFSMPQGGLAALESNDPLAVNAFQYDLVCNGYEIASGAIRNHEPEIMRKAFAIAGYEASELEARFGGLARAFRYGAPPHGGMAAGLDRIVMLLCRERNLREVALFPMTQRAEDLLMGAPSEVLPKQLRELHIRLDLPSVGRASQAGQTRSSQATPGIKIGEVTIKVDDSILDEVRNSAVGFLKFERNRQYATPAGTGTLAQLEGVKGIITAAHVIENLPTAGEIGLVRFSSIEPDLQNLRFEMEHADHVVLWDKIDGHAPDLGFLKLPSKTVAILESYGGVFYNLGKPRPFVPSSPDHRVSKVYAVVGVVAEWTEDAPGSRPGTKKINVNGLFGAAKVARQFEEGGTDLVEIEVDYSSGLRVPGSYEGISGGALWELHFELDGTAIVRIRKKLRGVAFRQSDDRRLVISNGTPSIETLIEEIRRKWPAAS